MQNNTNTSNDELNKSKKIFNRIIEFFVVFLTIYSALFISFIALEAPDERYEVELRLSGDQQDGELIRRFMNELRTPGEFVSFAEFNKRFEGAGSYWKRNVETVGKLDYIYLFFNLDKQTKYYRKMTIIRTIVQPLRDCIVETMTYEIVKSGCDRKFELFLANGIIPKENINFDAKKLFFYKMSTWIDKLDKFIEQAEYNLSKRETLAKLKSTKNFLFALHSSSRDELEKTNIKHQIHNQNWTIQQLDVENTSEKNLSHELRSVFVSAFISTAIIALFGGIGMVQRFLNTITGNISPTEIK